jgi:S1-C subfamily serine protease
LTSRGDSRLRISADEVNRAPQTQADRYASGNASWGVASPPQARRSRRPILAAVAIGLGLVVLVGGGLTIALAAIDRMTDGADAASGRSVRPATDAEQRSISKEGLAVVAPTVEGSCDTVGGLSQQWHGSAVPWRRLDGDLLVLVTNRHVSSPNQRQGTTNLEVTFGSGKSVPVRNVALPIGKNIDLALLLIDASSLQEYVDYCLLSPCPEDTWLSLKPGDDIVAVGSSLGYPQTQTFGRISALRPELASRMMAGRYVQFDATVLPGNSGGPLLQLIDDKWRWIGIVTAGSDPGVGFAIFAAELFQTSFRWVGEDGPAMQ